MLLLLLLSLFITSSIECHKLAKRGAQTCSDGHAIGEEWNNPNNKYVYKCTNEAKSVIVACISPKTGKRIAVGENVTQADGIEYCVQRTQGIVRHIFEETKTCEHGQKVGETYMDVERFVYLCIIVPVEKETSMTKPTTKYEFKGCASHDGGKILSLGTNHTYGGFLERCFREKPSVQDGFPRDGEMRFLREKIQN